MCLITGHAGATAAHSFGKGTPQGKASTEPCSRALQAGSAPRLGTHYPQLLGTLREALPVSRRKTLGARELRNLLTVTQSASSGTLKPSSAWPKASAQALQESHPATCPAPQRGELHLLLQAACRHRAQLSPTMAPQLSGSPQSHANLDVTREPHWGQGPSDTSPRREAAGAS